MNISHLPSSFGAKKTESNKTFKLLQNSMGQFTKWKLRISQICFYFGIFIFSENHQFQECFENSGKMSQENKKEKLQTAWKDFTERSLTVHTGSSGANHFYFQMNENLEISQKQKGNKETIRFLFDLGIMIFSEDYLVQECYENSEKISEENRKKFQTAWEDFTERSLSAHTGSSGMIHFYLHMSEDLEILHKQNGNKYRLRFWSYLGNLIFSANY